MSASVPRRPLHRDAGVAGISSVLPDDANYRLTQEEVERLCARGRIDLSKDRRPATYIEGTFLTYMMQILGPGKLPTMGRTLPKMRKIAARYRADAQAMHDNRKTARGLRDDYADLTPEIAAWKEVLTPAMHEFEVAEAALNALADKIDTHADELEDRARAAQRPTAVPIDGLENLIHIVLGGGGDISLTSEEYGGVCKPLYRFAWSFLYIARKKACAAAAVRGVPLPSHVRRLSRITLLQRLAEARARVLREVEKYAGPEGEEGDDSVPAR